MRKPRYELICADAKAGLKKLPRNFIHQMITSPPYWGQRDYNTGTWQGGDPSCDHRSPTMKAARNENRRTLPGSVATSSSQLLLSHRSGCGKCGAVLVDDQLGLEPTPEQYTENMVEVFREAREVLRQDGTLWINIGDTYQAAKGQAGGVDPKNPARRHGLRPNDVSVPGLKPKDIVGIPWRLAFALQADGWYWRDIIIWNKPNGLGHPNYDRTVCAHEYILVFSKSRRYFYDYAAILDPAKVGNNGKQVQNGKTAAAYNRIGHREREDFDTRLCRSVWTIPVNRYRGAHFATFPLALPTKCIKAGASERGCCPKCGTPSQRIVKHTRIPTRPGAKTKLNGHGRSETGNRDPERHITKRETIGWRQGCDCESIEPVPCRVLDMFNGSGTTGQAAMSLGIDYYGIDLNPDYLEQSQKRLRPFTELLF